MSNTEARQRPHDVFQMLLEKGEYDAITEAASVVWADNGIPFYQITYRLSGDNRAISARYPLAKNHAPRTREELNKLGLTSMGELDTQIKKHKIKLMILKKIENGIEFNEVAHITKGIK